MQKETLHPFVPGTPRFGAGEDTAGSIDEAQLYRRIALKVVPLLMLGYFISYIDRVNVGFAKLQMLDALGLSENVYGVGASAFFWGYLLMQVPASLVIYRFGVRRCLPAIMCLWGASSAAMIFTHSATSFYLLRFLLGVCEAGFFPSVAVYLSGWFPPYRQGKIMSIFLLAMPLGIVLSGPLAGWVMSAAPQTSGLMGWQWLFVIEAIPAVVVGLVMCFRLDSGVGAAKWLTANERQRVVDNTRQVGVRQTASFTQALKELKLWHLVAISLLFNIGNWGLVFWMPTIVKALGDGTPLQTGLLTAVPYLAASLTMLANGYHAERHREIRLHTAIPVAVGGVALAASAFCMAHPLLALVLLSVAASGVLATLSMFWSLPAQNLTGTAAAGGVGLVNAASSLAGIIGPVVMGFLVQHFHNTQIGVCALAVPMILSAVLVFLLPRTVNKKETEQALGSHG